MKMAHKLSLRKKLLFTAILFIAQLLVLEGALRLIQGEYYAENQFFPHNRDISFVSIYDKDPGLFWRLKRNITAESKEFSSLAYHINNWGFRGPDIDEDSEKPSLIALGNSCTFGWGVPYDSIFTARLQSALPAAQVINLGTPGYSSYQGKVLLKRLKQQPVVFRARVALIMYGWNDHWPAAGDIDDKSQKTAPGWTLALQNMLSRLKLFQFVRQITLDVAAGGKKQKPAIDRVAGKRRVELADFRRNLSEIIALCRESRTVPILLVPPIASLEVYMPDAGSSAFHDLHAAYQSVIREAALENRTVLLDLQPAFDNRNDLFDFPAEDPVHFNSAGHEVVFEEVMKTLRDNNLLPLLK